MSINEQRSYTEYNVTVPTTDFVVGFDFMDEGIDIVQVTLNDVDPTTLGYTILQVNNTTYRFAPPVPEGIVRLSRVTDIDSMAHVFTEGAIFVSENMDDNFKQIRHAQQEVKDNFNKLSTDTYAIIGTLEDVSEDAQAAAAAAQEAADTANEAASQVSDKLSKSEIRKGALDWKQADTPYNVGYRVALNNGDIVRSTVPNNIVNPNVDMTGWVNANNGIDVNTIADLLAINSPQDGMRVFVKGYHAPTLFVEANPYKGGGTFVWDATSTATPNNGTVFAVNGIATGRWIRQLAGSELITPQMFGARADGVTDDYDAIMAAINSFKSGDVWSGRSGQTVFFPNGRYYLRDTIQLKTAVKLLGDQSAMGGVQAKVTLLFPNNKDGIVVNRYNTNGATGVMPAPVDNSGADGAIIEGITVSQLNNNRQYLRVIEFNQGNSTILTSGVKNFEVGDSISQYSGLYGENFTAIVTSRTTLTNLFITLTSVSGFALGETVVGQTSGASAKIVYVSSGQLAIGVNTVSGTFVANETIIGSTSSHSAIFSLSKNWTGFNAYGLSSITGALKNEDGNAKDKDAPNSGDHVLIKTGSYGTGIVLRARAQLESVAVTGWARYGIAVYGIADGANANNSIINKCSIIRCNLDGFYTRGGDSNACTITALNAASNGRYGVNDSSFLGNHYFSCHTASNGAGAYYSNATNNFSVFLGCYSEGDAQVQPFNVYTSKFGQYTTVIGGDHGAGINNSGNGNCSILAGQSLQVAGFKANNYSTDFSVGRDAALQIWSSGSQTMGIGNFVEHLIPQSNGGKDAQISGGKYGFIREDRNSSSYHIYALSNQIAGNTTLVVSGGGGGSGFSGYPVVTNGVITDILIKNSGSGYTAPLTITAQGTWAGLQATADVFNGKVVKVTVTNSPINLPPTDPVLALKVRETYTQAGADNIASLGTTSVRWKQGFINDLRLKPSASVTPAVNGELAFELTNDTTLKFKVKGSDGVVRSATLTLA